MITTARERATVTHRTLIDALNKDLAGEYQAIIMYVQYAALTTGPCRLQLQPFLSAQVADEIAHARFLAEKITALGGTPTTEPRPVPTATSNRQILENVLDAERHTIAAYTDRVYQADELGDIALRAEIERQIQDETRHAEEIEKLLRTWTD